MKRIPKALAKIQSVLNKFREFKRKTALQAVFACYMHGKIWITFKDGSWTSQRHRPIQNIENAGMNSHTSDVLEALCFMRLITSEEVRSCWDFLREKNTRSQRERDLKEMRWLADKLGYSVTKRRIPAVGIIRRRKRK